MRREYARDTRRACSGAIDVREGGDPEVCGSHDREGVLAP